jgi:plastocyanin
MLNRVNRTAALIAALLMPVSGSILAADATLALTIKNHKFSPAEPTIPTNTKVTVTVKNLDATPAEFESDDFKAEKVVPAGKQVTLFIGPFKPGKYEFHDEYHEDVSKTHLIVK